jgi:predicted Zn-dependent peptidase
LINTLFGERFTSMLNDELRINSGLTYGAGSRIQIDRIPGAIRIQTFTKTDTTAQAINLALDVLKRLYTRGLTAEQLASAKKYVKGIYPTQNLETPEQVASVVGDLELFGMNKGEIDDLFSRIDAVNLEQANRAIKRYFQPVNLQFCLVGQASKIRETVGEYAKDVKVVSSASPGFVIP